MIVIDAVVATTPRVSAASVRFEIEFVQGDGTSHRVQIVSSRRNPDLAEVTRGSRLLIGGHLLCSGVHPLIVAGSSVVLWLAPATTQERAAPRVHDVGSHWRLLASGRRIRVRAHVRGRAGVARAIGHLAGEGVTG